MNDSPFMFPAEVDKLIPVCDLTRARMEKRGLFPRRLRITPRRIAWRYSLNQCEFPTGMAIDEANRRLFIACGKSARLLIFDLSKHRVVTSVPIGFGPDSVAYDPQLRRIYTTGLMGTLSVIQQDTADTYRAVDSIRLHFNAHTLAVDPVTHELFVGYTGFLFQPRLAVFSPVR